MIIDQDPKGYYDKIVDESNPEKKAFNLLLAILVVVLIAFGSSIVYLKAEQKDLNIEIRQLQSTNLKDDKECDKRVQDAIDKQKAEDKIEYDKLYESYNDNIEKFEERMNYVTRELLKVKKNR